jgi:hypothetical protein
MSQLLTKAAILASQDLKHENIDIPEWGGVVRLRTMTGAERDAFEARSIQTHGDKREVDMSNFRARLVAQTLVDENGALLFNENEITALGGKSAAALDRCFEAAQRLNGIGRTAEALAKN